MKPRIEPRGPLSGTLPRPDPRPNSPALESSVYILHSFRPTHLTSTGLAGPAGCPAGPDSATVVTGSDSGGTLPTLEHVPPRDVASRQDPSCADSCVRHCRVARVVTPPSPPVGHGCCEYLCFWLVSFGSEVVSRLTTHTSQEADREGESVEIGSVREGPERWYGLVAHLGHEWVRSGKSGDSTRVSSSDTIPPTTPSAGGGGRSVSTAHFLSYWLI